MSIGFARLEELPRRTSSEAKNQWSALSRDVRARGSVAVTHHGRVEMVVVDAAIYREMAALVEDAKTRDRASLAELTAEFDRHLERVQAPEARERADAAMESRGRATPRPKAGPSF
jgi:prevent-host-death family protein